MYSVDRGDGCGPKQLQWRMGLCKAKWDTEQRVRISMIKIKKSFREEEAFELECKSDGMRGKYHILHPTFKSSKSKLIIYTIMWLQNWEISWKKPLKTLVLDNHLMQWWHTACLIQFPIVLWLAHREEPAEVWQIQHRPWEVKTRRQDLKSGHTDFQTERVQSVRSSEHLQDPQDSVFSAGWLDSPKYKSWPCQCYAWSRAGHRLDSLNLNFQLDNEYSFTHHTVFL